MYIIFINKVKGKGTLYCKVRYLSLAEALPNEKAVVRTNGKLMCVISRCVRAKSWVGAQGVEALAVQS